METRLLSLCFMRHAFVISDLQPRCPATLCPVWPLAFSPRCESEPPEEQLRSVTFCTVTMKPGGQNAPQIVLTQRRETLHNTGVWREGTIVCTQHPKITWSVSNCSRQRRRTRLKKKTKNIVMFSSCEEEAFLATERKYWSWNKTGGR